MEEERAVLRREDEPGRRGGCGQGRGLGGGRTYGDDGRERVQPERGAGDSTA